MSEMTMNGISICPRGEERYEYFTPAYARRTGKRYCQYDYRTEGGELFSCVAPTLDKCRKRRNEWIKGKMVCKQHCSRGIKPVCDTRTIAFEKRK